MSGVMGIVIRGAFWEFAKTKIWAELTRDLLIFIGSYITVTIGAFVVNIFRVPALLDAECRQETLRLSQQLELPDKAQADYLCGLIAKLSDSGKAVIRLALHHQEVSFQQMKIEGLSDDALRTAVQECFSIGLLRHRNDMPSSALYWLGDVYWIPEEFHVPLKRLLYRPTE
jgi:hypothetical protein